ncbi:MAG: Na+/H+ antiporter NhaC family protein [Acidobacteria bacterium]|nr:MAG: Na+/H+ antiporter NhaC family protein [Acidobacteriota bacterium]
MLRRRPRAAGTWLAVAVIASLAGLPAPAQQRPVAEIGLDAPAVLLRGVAREVRVDCGELGPAVRAIEVAVGVADRTPVIARRTVSGCGPRETFAVTLPSDAPGGRAVITARLEDGAGRVLGVAARPTRSLASIWAFVPPLLAIALALAFRQVLPALVIGVLAGALIRGGFAPLDAVLRMLDFDLVRALAEPGDATKGHLKIALFTIMLGGMVGLISRSGGAAGLVRAVGRWARGRRSGQLAAWFAGLLVFFDDYANTLVVGPSLRPLTDRLRISREKLAFIVDATAAPVASVAIISTWIGYEVGLIGDAIGQTSLAGTDPYGVFLASLPYRFYAWLMLGFVALVALTGRDFGAMHRAEQRAARTGAALRPGSQPLARTDALENDEPAPARQALWLALGPIATLTGVTFLSLWLTGRASLAAAGEPAGTEPVLAVLTSLRRVGEVLGAASSFDALLYGAAGGVFVALVVALALRRLSLDGGARAFVDGCAAMTMGVMILTLAWMIGGVCRDLGTAEAAVRVIGDGLPVRLIPAAVFVVAGAVSFATGSSWTTMAVLVPVALPLADRLGTAAGLSGDGLERLIVAAVGSVLTGAVWGDHCSPLSDTTVMSSFASGCDHVDHVRTQIPYALAVGAVGLLVGDLAVGFGVPPVLGLALGLALLAGLLVWRGRRVDEPAPRPSTSP